MTEKSTDTKEKLKEISYDIFSTHDIESVSVDEICRRAGVTKGAFYHYFESKNDIPMSQYREIQKAFFDDYVKNVDRPTVERLHEVIMWYGRYCSDDNIHFFRNYFRSMNDHQQSRKIRRIEMMDRVLKELIRQGQSDGVFSKQADADFTAELIYRFITSLLFDWTVFKGDIDLKGELGAFWDQIIASIGTDIVPRTDIA